MNLTHTNRNKHIYIYIYIYSQKISRHIYANKDEKNNYN